LGGSGNDQMRAESRFQQSSGARAKTPLGRSTAMISRRRKIQSINLIGLGGRVTYLK